MQDRSWLLQMPRAKEMGSSCHVWRTIIQGRS